MTLESLQQEKIFAMKNRGKFTEDTISILISMVKKTGAENGYKDNIPEELVNQTILKALNTIQELIDKCPISRTATLEEYQAKKKIIERFVPKSLADKDKIKDLILSLGIEVNGKNRSAIMSQLNGKVNMKIASEVLMEMI